MKKYIPTIALAICVFSSFAQTGNSYTAFIQHDTAIKWAAECNKIANLTPKVSDYSIKQFYLAKLKKGEAKAYTLNNDKRSATGISLEAMDLERPAWLTGLYPKFIPVENVWTFIDKKDPAKSYRLDSIGNNPCCGCDEANAIRIKQILYFKKSRFYIQNVLLSPLCARKETDDKAAWFPVCNVAYNPQQDNNKPIALSKDMVLINSENIVYNFRYGQDTPEDSVLTVGSEHIFSRLFDDIYAGRIKAYDSQTGKLIPGKKIRSWGTQKFTVQLYNDNGDPTGTKEISSERNSDSLWQVRIQQDWYFDFKNEKLYSRVKWIELLTDVYTSTGFYLGRTPFCRINY